MSPIPSKLELGIRSEYFSGERTRAILHFACSSNTILVCGCHEEVGDQSLLYYCTEVLPWTIQLWQARQGIFAAAEAEVPGSCAESPMWSLTQHAPLLLSRADLRVQRSKMSAPQVLPLTYYDLPSSTLEPNN